MKFNLNLDSINYIKIVYQDENSSTRCTKAAIKRMGEREIFACAKFEDGLNIKTPQDILLSFICDNGLYRTTTPLKFIESEPPYVFFTIKTPFVTVPRKEFCALGRFYPGDFAQLRISPASKPPASPRVAADAACGNAANFLPSSNGNFPSVGT